MEITGWSIKKLRIEAGLTQKRLGKLAGVSQSHIAKIELGKVDPRLSTVNKILQILSTGKKTCLDVMSRNVLSARADDNVLRASEIMTKNAISQLPIMENGEVIGTITEETIIRNLSSDLASSPVKRIMDPPLPTVSENTRLEAIQTFLEKNAALLVIRDGKIVGIVTRSDLLKTI